MVELQFLRLRSDGFFVVEGAPGVLLEEVGVALARKGRGEIVGHARNSISVEPLRAFAHRSKIVSVISIMRRKSAWAS